MNAGQGLNGGRTELDQFIDSLRSNGLIVSNRSDDLNYFGKARYYIPRVGTHRFSAYFHSLRGRTHGSGTTKVSLDDVLRLNKFDRHLRLLSLDALERIEVTAKSYLTDVLERQIGEQWYTQLDQHFTEKLARELKGSIEHHPDYRNVYGSDLTRMPPGIAMDSLTLHNVRNMYLELPDQGKDRIASKFATNSTLLSQWLNSLRIVRNTAAHHSVLWNKIFEKPPAFPISISNQFGNVGLQPDSHARFYAQAIYMFNLLQRTARRTQWHVRLLRLLHSNESVRPRVTNFHRSMGFPQGWYRKPFWKFEQKHVEGISEP